MAYGIIDGVVDRVFFDGKGVAFHEEFKKSDGSTGKAFFSGFSTEPHGLKEGDRGTFKGNLSVKARTYTDTEGNEKVTADATLNNLKFVPAGASEDEEPF